MNIVSRSGWGAKPSTRPLQPDRQPWPRLWLHHTVTSAANPSNLMRLVQDYHQGKGWRDFAYNFAVAMDGQVFEGAGEGNQHLNSDAGQSGTIVWLGNFETVRPSEALIDSTAWLVAHGLLSGWWAAALDGSPHITGGHSQIPGAKPTACPGRHALAAIPEINRRAAKIIYKLGHERANHMAWIIRATDPSGKERNALTDGIYRREFVSVQAMTTTRDGMGLATVTLPWEVWLNQFADPRQLPLADFPKAATAAEVVEATQAAVDQIKEALLGLSVDGGPPATGEDARKLLLKLLGV